MQAAQVHSQLRRWLSLLRSPNAASRLHVGAAFAAVYLIWGSTYLAIRFAIETLPPFFMAGARFIVAGSLLYTWAWWRGAPRPTRLHWREAAIVGGLMLLGGNGSVTWAEQRIPSGLAALLVATVPLWMVLLEGVRPGGARPSARVAAGLGLGLTGVALLIGPGNLTDGERGWAGGQSVDLSGAVAVLFAALAWAAGSLYSRRAHLPAAPLQGVAMEMLAGGAWLLLASGVTGEGSRLDLGGASPRSLLALGYLIAFGSIVAFTAYLWLLRVSTPARASTYAFVNPVVAVFLGWALADEPFTAQTLLAAGVIVAAVVIITTGRSRSERRLE
jgi:drug/metabolite transporter (DMT)-like permease